MEKCLESLACGMTMTKSVVRSCENDFVAINKIYKTITNFFIAMGLYKRIVYFSCFKI